MNDLLLGLRSGAKVHVRTESTAEDVANGLGTDGSQHVTGVDAAGRPVHVLLSAIETVTAIPPRDPNQPGIWPPQLETKPLGSRAVPEVH